MRSGLPMRRSGRSTAGLLVGGVLLASTAANAACIHTGQVFSCTDVHGKAMQLFCFGVGAVLTCMEATGSWILVGPHEVLSQISSIDSVVSSALAAAREREDTPEVASGTNPALTADNRTVKDSLPRRALIEPGKRKDYQILVRPDHVP